MQLCLDKVSKGKTIDTYINKKTLPENITKRMLIKDVIKISGPSFIELMLTQITSMIDLVMVGGIGVWAISAISLTIQPKFLMMTLFLALNVDTTALIARYKGAGEYKKMNEVLRQALVFTTLIAIIMSIIGYCFAEPLMKFMGATEEILIIESVKYFRIQMLGLVSLALTSTITAAFRGIGNSKTAMFYNTIANLINIIFNWFLIGGEFIFPELGITGASIATVIGQIIAMIIAIICLLREKDYFEINYTFKKFDLEILINLIRIGIPSMIQQLFMRAGMIMYSKTVISLGTNIYAVHNICMNIQAISFMVGQSIGTATTTLVGQSLGKMRVDMAKHYMSISIIIGIVLSLLLALSFLLFSDTIMQLYSSDVMVIKTGSTILLFLAFIQPFQCIQFVVAGGLSGAGDSKSTATIIFITILIIRPVVAEVLVTNMGMGIYGAWIALASDQLLRSILILIRYISNKWIYVKLKGI